MIHITEKQLHEDLKKANDKEILRQQMKLLAEWCRSYSKSEVPAASQAMAEIHKELVKTECFSFMRFAVFLFCLLYFMKNLSRQK